MSSPIDTLPQSRGVTLPLRLERECIEWRKVLEEPVTDVENQ